MLLIDNDTAGAPKGPISNVRYIEAQCTCSQVYNCPEGPALWLSYMRICLSTPSICPYVLINFPMAFIALPLECPFVDVKQ